jgi:hypothetical protein
VVRQLIREIEVDAERLLPELLTDYVGGDVSVKRHIGEAEGLFLDLAGTRFVVEARISSRAPMVAAAAERALERASRLGVDPLVVVPHMGPTGAEVCRTLNVSYVDLSGNAHIVAPGIRVHVEGRRNQFTVSGAPLNAFAPKSARISRSLLLEPDRWFSQRELAGETDLDKGHVSRIVRRLDRDLLLERNLQGEFRARDPKLLLDSWREAYDFSKHRIVTGHIPARGGEQLLDVISRHFQTWSIRHAATGLAGAWLYDRFAMFRLAVFFVEFFPPAGSMLDIGFRESASGANVWLVRPNDRDVYRGATALNGVSVVSPIQAYLDLKGMPERAEEAAEHLEQTHLMFGR